MARIRLIDTKDTFRLTIDETDIPYVTTYSLSKSVNGFLTMQVNLSVDEVEEIVIDSDQDVFMRKETAKSGRRK